MIVLIPYINLLNLSWLTKCLFLRNMEPSMCMIMVNMVAFLKSCFVSAK